MYKAIIVDDEVKICQLIRCLGKWETFQIEIIECCQDGETALECIFRERPDIVLTDIRMPIYDGLEIIQNVRKEGLETAFIVISGYKQFEYARQALQYGVVDFLVKPINENDLNIALEKAITSINDVRRREEADSILFNSERREKEQFLSRIVSLNEDEKVSEKLEKSAEKIQFESEVFQAVLLKTNKQDLNQTESVFSENIVHFVEDMFQIGETIAVARDGGIYILLNYKKEEEPLIKNGFYEILKHIKQESDIYGRFDVTLGVGLPVYNIGQMHRSIQTAKVAWQERIIRNEREVIEYGRLIQPDGKCEAYLQDEDWRELRRFLETCDVNGIKMILRTMEAGIGRANRISVQILLEEVKQIIIMVQKQISEDETDWSKAEESIFEEMRLCNTVSDLFLRLTHFSVTRIQAYHEEKIMAKKMPVLAAEKFLAQNYMKDISLEDMAKQVELSPAYFSKLFKSVEGKNYIDYLTELRLEKAKDLLKTTNQPIKTIALEVGYPNEKYFHKLFKKVVGIKASEYRKLH